MIKFAPSDFALQGWQIIFADNGWSTERFTTDLWTSKSGSSQIRSDGTGLDRFLLDFSKWGAFGVSFPDQEIRVIRGPEPATFGQFDTDGAAEDTIIHLLADQVIPRVMSHQGNLVLHAAALHRDGEAIALLGVSGVGKSTLAASLNQHGFELLGDDAIVVSCVDDHVSVKPVYPSLRLNLDSISSLFPDRPELLPVAHYTTKQRVLFPTPQFSDYSSMRLRAVFLLAPESGPDTISLRRKAKSETCFMLLESSFWLNPKDHLRDRRTLEQTSRVAALVPGFEFSYPREFGLLPKLRQTIEQCLAGLGQSGDIRLN